HPYPERRILRSGKGGPCATGNCFLFRDGRRSTMTADEAWNPFFRALWEHCRAKPDAMEDHPWGETVFKVRDKCFAFLGIPDRAAVTVKPDPEDLDALLALPFVERAAYIGRYGWVKVAIADEDALAL